MIETAFAAIVNGKSIRAAARLSGAPNRQIKQLMLTVGDACARLHESAVRGVEFTSLECRGALLFEEKARGAPPPRRDRPLTDFAWAWTCLDYETGFVPLWRIAPRTALAAASSVSQILQLKPHRVVIVDEGDKRIAVDLSHGRDPDIQTKDLLAAFGFGGDRAVDPLVETDPPPGATFNQEEWRRAASEGFAKKILRYEAAMALLLTFHNFATWSAVRGVSPAMASGISDHVWSISEIGRLSWP